MSGNKYNGLYMREITDAIKEIAVKHNGDFWEIRTLIDDLVVENALQVAIEHYRRNSKGNRDLIVAYRNDSHDEWGYLEGTQWRDGCIVLNDGRASGPRFFNSAGCLLQDFHRYISADKVMIVYLDNGERLP